MSRGGGYYYDVWIWVEISLVPLSPLGHGTPPLWTTTANDRALYVPVEYFISAAVIT